MTAKRIPTAEPHPLPCVACGEPTREPSGFCTRVECLTFGSGACAAGPSIRNS